MASPDFWRDLAGEFRAVPDGWTLRAEWYADAEIPVLESWLVTSHTTAARDADAEIPGLARWVVTGSTATAKHSFEALATRAATGIATADTCDLLAAWLDQLRRERFGFKPMRFHLIKHRDSSEITLCVGGQIPGVCEVSENYCKRLESRALQSEFEIQRQSKNLTTELPEEAPTPASPKRPRTPAGTDSAKDRRAAVEAYIAEVLRKTGKRITRKDLWKAAGYKCRTEFERWQRKDSEHPNKSAHDRFTRILRDKPHLN